MSRENPKIRDDGGCGDYCFCIRKPKEEDKFKTSENRLGNWAKWMRRRGQIHNKIARPLGRPVEELLMNMGDEYRNIQEDREVFYYTKLDTNFDKFRGNPEFWKLPVGLIDKRDRSQDPIYFTVKTKFEKNEIPAIEYVRNPNYILDEKNVLSHTRKMYALWKKSKYRKAQMKTLSSKVNLIEPHKPECEELIIVGQKLGRPKKEVAIAKLQSESKLRYPPEVSITGFSFAIHEIPKLCFSINGITLSNKDSLVNDTVKFRVLFECAANLKVPVLHHLRIENKGRTTLRFYWNRIDKFRIFRNLTQDERKECQEFYFNKNELLLIPGTTTALPVWFKAKKVGNYIQFWKITTRPKFWDDDFQLILLLQGIVHIVGHDEKSENIKNMLEVRARSTLIKDLLKSMLENLTYTETETTTFVFTEREVFESVNQELWWCTEKRSKYLYDKNIVNELKQFYQEVRQPNSPPRWNFSVRDLKIITRKKDITDYVESKTKEAMKARKRRIELREEPKIDPQAAKKVAVPKEKAGTPPVAATAQEEEDMFVIKEMRYNQLEDILHTLERPLMVENRDREKHFRVYIIMRTYLFKMCDALETYDNYVDYSLTDEDYYPTFQYDRVTSIDEFPERLIFERFDEMWLDGTKLIQPEGKFVDPVFPKPEILKGIPQEDTKAIYHTYFNIPIVEPAQVKGKKDDKKEKMDKGANEKKGKDGDDKNKKGDAKVIEPPKKISTVKEGFDPYREEYTPPKTDRSEDLKSHSQHYVEETEINYYRYLIVYSHLTDAVNAMVDILETFKENVVSFETLGELKKCTSIYPKEVRRSAEMEVLDIEDLKVTVSTQESEDTVYYQYLLDSHLNKNINTQKYIIYEHTEGWDEDQVSTISELTAKYLSRPNVFRSHETIVESIYPSGNVSVGIQTSDIDEEFPIPIEQFVNDSLDRTVLSQSVNTENTIGETLSHDMFYFMDDSDDEGEVEAEDKEGSNE